LHRCFQLPILKEPRFFIALYQLTRRRGHDRNGNPA
jgi:hypothetical protein